MSPSFCDATSLFAKGRITPISWDCPEELRPVINVTSAAIGITAHHAEVWEANSSPPLQSFCTGREILHVFLIFWSLFPQDDAFSELLGICLPKGWDACLTVFLFILASRTRARETKSLSLNSHPFSVGEYFLLWDQYQPSLACLIFLSFRACQPGKPKMCQVASL